MKRMDVEKLLAGLFELQDKRRQWGNLRHKLTDILFIILCAIMCGMEDIEGIAIFGKERQEWLRKYIEMKNGAPSYATYERVLRMMEPKEVEKFYRAWAKEDGLCLGQIKTNEKTNEIAAIQELLDVSECVVSIDAMGCQKKIAEKIRKKNADYLLAVKRNQPTLNEGIREYMESIDAGQGP